MKRNRRKCFGTEEYAKAKNKNSKTICAKCPDYIMCGKYNESRKKMCYLQ